MDEQRTGDGGRPDQERSYDDRAAAAAAAACAGIDSDSGSGRYDTTSVPMQQSGTGCSSSPSFPMAFVCGLAFMLALVRGMAFMWVLSGSLGKSFRESLSLLSLLSFTAEVETCTLAESVSFSFSFSFPVPAPADGSAGTGGIAIALGTESKRECVCERGTGIDTITAICT